MVNFSEYFNLPIHGHRDIDFIDVPVDTDVKLFLDPALIEAGTDEFSRWCANSIKSFFDAAFYFCHTRNLRDLRILLRHSAEPNETHLGLSVAQSRGRGASEEILFNVFSELIERGLFARGAVLHPCDICVLAPNFDKDRMSDLITNILRNHLSRFTEQQCLKHGVPLDGVREGYWWDEQATAWEEKQWLAPMAYSKPVLLVPKHFVSWRYHFDTSTYISRYVLTYRQEHHLNKRTELCHKRELKNGHERLSPPTKKELKVIELSGTPGKVHALGFAYAHPDTMRHFGAARLKMMAEIDYTLTNQQLDELLYAGKSKLA